MKIGNNEIVVWEAVQLEPCRDVDVRDVDGGCIILALHVSCVQFAVP